MKNAVSKLKNILHFEKKYHYLKKLEPSKYSQFLEEEYKRRTGESLNLAQPKKYTEKMQYAKLNLNTTVKTKLSDKYLVREWVSSKIGSEYLIPLLGVWDNFSEIKFNTLPNKFVLKLNSGTATNIVVKNKDEFNYLKNKLKFNRWMKMNFAFAGDIQPHYADIKPKIIAEQYIEDSNGELPESKFFCFNGKVYYCWEIIGRGTQEYRNIYDANWNLQPWTFYGHKNTPYKLKKPDNFEEMVEVATKLSENFSHVRVDLYNVDGKIYFGEMTFTSTGGFRHIIPEKYNYMLGDLWDLEVNK